MAKAKFDIKTEATRPFYAGVGVTDLAVEAVRDYVADVQKKLTEAQKDLQKSVSGLEFEPKAVRAAIEARVAELQAEAKAYPAKVQTVVADNVATATSAYGDLVQRGETLVSRIRKQEATKATKASAKTTTAKAKATKTQATKATKSTAKKTATTAKKTAAKKAAPAKSSAKATVTAAQQTAASAVQATTDGAAKVGD